MTAETTIATSSRFSRGVARPVTRTSRTRPRAAVAPAQDRADRDDARDALQQSVPASKDPNARLYPEHWLANIRTMLREKHREDALRSLAEFRRLYPDYRLPDDLRDLK